MEEIRPPKNYIVYDFVRVTASPGLIVLRPKLVYENEAAERFVKHGMKGGVLLISNHSGFFDPVHLMLSIWRRRHHFVCIKDFFEGNGFKRWLFTQFHCIPIDRDNFSMGSLRRITDELKAGKLVSMFPEGHINEETEGVAAFKSGMVLMAMRSGVPIVPVYVRRFEGFPRRLVMAVGEAIDIAELCGGRPTMSRIDEISALLHEKEDELRELAEKR